MMYLFFKKIIILISLSLLFSRDSALSIGENNRQISLFQPYIIATEQLEISTHPILFFVKPNFKIKRYIVKKYDFDFAGRFSFDYPTKLLEFIQRKGEFGILSIDPTIPKISNLFIVQSEMLITKQFLFLNLTNKIGISLCPSCDLDSRNIIDLPIIYPRMRLYQNKILSNIGFDLEYLYLEKFSFKTDIDVLILSINDIFFEHKLLFNYFINEKISLTTGYKLAFGEYPYGSQIDLYPIIDFSYHWTVK